MWSEEEIEVEARKTHAEVLRIFGERGVRCEEDNMVKVLEEMERNKDIHSDSWEEMINAAIDNTDLTYILSN